MKKVMIMIFALALILGITMIIAVENSTNNSTDTNSATNTTTNVTTNNTAHNNTGKWTDRCSAVDHRVSGLVDKYNENNGTKRFSNFVDILERMINRADETGLNTTQLQDDLIILNTKIDKFQADYSVFVQKLQATRNFTCGHSEGQFVNALNISKAQLKIVRADVDDIKGFFQSTIKNDLMNMRQERKDNKPPQGNQGMMNKTGNKTAYPGNMTPEELQNKRQQLMQNIKNRIKGALKPGQ